jgi:hypothetical protein
MAVRPQDLASPSQHAPPLRMPVPVPMSVPVIVPMSVLMTVVVHRLASCRGSAVHAICASMHIRK